MIVLGDQDVTPRVLSLLLLLWCLLDTNAVVRAGAATPASRQEELLVVAGPIGQHGGQLVVTQRAEPRTLNPVTAADAPSREVIRRTIGDLIHINRETHEVEPALARSWSISPEGRRLTLSLRRGIRFSDGDGFDADDVVFSFRVYLDEKIGSPQRDLLLVGGRPITVRKVDQYTVEFGLAAPYSVAERIFDSIAMLPQHLLERPYAEGRLAEVWSLATPPSQIAGLGPFRFREHVGGQRVVPAGVVPSLGEIQTPYGQVRNRQAPKLWTVPEIPTGEPVRRPKSPAARYRPEGWMPPRSELAPSQSQ